MKIKELSLDSHLHLMSNLEKFWGKNSSSFQMFHHPLFPLIFNSSSFIYQNQNQIISYLYGVLYQENAFVQTIATHENYRHQGYGRQLLEYWESSLQKENVKNFYCYILRENRLSKKFFISQGYHFLSSIEVFPNSFRDLYIKE